MQKLLDKYLNDKLRLTPILNIGIGGTSKIDIYKEIGKYLANKFDNNLPPALAFYNSKLENIFKRKQAYASIGIMFLTSALSEKVIAKLYGPGIKHSEFGEGFDRERKYSFVSTFIEKNGHIFHLGNDHRGTIIESEFITREELLICLKMIVDDYVTLFD